MTRRLARAGLYPLVGAALLTPVAVALGVPILTAPTLGRVLLWWAACLPGAVLLAMTPLIRRLEVAALAELLDVDVPHRADRVYLTVLTSLHLFVGATLSAGLAALSPELLRLGDGRPGAPGDSAEVLLVAVAVLIAMVAAGSGQRWAARRLLRTEPSRLVDALDRRQSLALELHDSVGHALSVVLVQAMAAEAALQRTEPTLAAQSLDHLASTARIAQQDLDVLLSVLDDGVTEQAPTLSSLGTLIRGLDVRARADPLDRVPAATSRAAFAITREALTNALRHGHGPVTLDLAVGAGLVVTAENATIGAAAGPGRGLTGMRMRARLAGGDCTWREVDGTWRVQAVLPL
ncbi:signal transduction histidine kinase [Actinoplanes octamycinicus]|uniref:histidine kinase n=1 Tax=Actinoplanes octamycinicus TaxID=135948 RepID=A0A7W7M9E6_9ACTN|nr:histidine kinase [Actinoplanes octamycinicus]MBB4741857.1 signal transduction histidine kinase [Actinoplanes octamycinicus]GIE60621.1 histidine kinase [Actinoplanes octamycinicus]